MAKQIWFVPVLGLCLACGGSTPPAEEPTTPSSSTEEATPENEETPSETPAETSDPPAESDGGSGETGAKKKCEELDKSTCKVTIGCGWNDVKKCVDTSVSE